MASYDFSGKRALVTGAGKGIGRASAVALSESGAEVIALSRTQADLDSLKQQCPKIQTTCVDLIDWEATRKAVLEAGPVHLLVNNAGISIGLGSCLEAQPDDFDKMIGVNVKSVMNVTQVVAKGMVERRGGGSIVMVSSLVSSRAAPDHLLYCTTKGALDQMMRVFALELGPHQIRVNSVNPTVVMTEMGKRIWSDPAKQAPVLARTPLGKFAEEEHCVNAILFLLSEKSDMVNGSTLPLEGGYLCC